MRLTGDPWPDWAALGKWHGQRYHNGAFCGRWGDISARAAKSWEHPRQAIDFVREKQGVLSSGFPDL